MIVAWLIPLVGEQYAKRVAIALGILAVIAALALAWFLWLGSHDRKVLDNESARQQAQATKADDKATQDRAITTQILANDTQELKNAVAPLPDKPLTDRQRARYCAIVLRQQGQSYTPPAICRPNAKP